MATKKEIMEKLDALGAKYDKKATLDDLNALYAELATATAAEEAPNDDVPAEAPEPATAAEEANYVVAAPLLALRSTPEQADNRIAVLPKGTTVAVEEVGDVWTYIPSKGGYVMTEYIKPVTVTE